MTLRGHFTTGLVFVLAVSVGAASAQNAVINGDFAASLAGWTTSPAECSFTASQGRTAPGAAQCTVALEGPNTVIAMRQCVPALAGAAYEFGSAIRLQSSPHPTALGFVRVIWFSNPDCSGPGLGSAPTQSVFGTDWQDVKAIFQVAPAGTTRASVALGRGLGIPGSVTVFFDDVFFERSCVNTATVMCLTGSRFKVSATFRTAQGQTGAAQAVRLTSDSGYFTFFSPQNAELFVKTANACTAPFDRFWFFGAGLTDVEVTIQVTDTKSGQTKTYTNPLGTPFKAIQDTNAFATCP